MLEGNENPGVRSRAERGEASMADAPSLAPQGKGLGRALQHSPSLHHQLSTDYDFFVIARCALVVHLVVAFCPLMSLGSNFVLFLTEEEWLQEQKVRRNPDLPANAN